MASKREKLVAGQMDAPPEDEAAKEQWIQEYARVLEDLKAKDPEEYKRVVAQLQQQVAGGAGGGAGGIKLPGGKSRLGANGLEAVSEVEREEVIPAPGFVIKTRAPHAAGGGGSGGDGGGGDSQKVFINVCTSDKLKKFRQVKKKLADGSVQEGLNIPLSCGARKVERDRAGRPCLVYDMIVHPSVVSEALADKTGNFRHWVCNFALQYVTEKHRVQVDFKYKLPKMKYMGDLSGGKTPTMQHIRKVGPTIEVVETEEAGGNTSKKKPRGKAAAKAAARALEFATYAVRCQFDDGRPDQLTATSGNKQPGPAAGGPTAAAAPATATTYTDFLASGAAADDLPARVEVRVSFARLPPADRGRLQVDMSQELVVVAAPGYRRLELFLPLPVRRGGVAAEFDGLAGGGGELVLTMDVDAERVRDADADSTNPDEGSRPWLLADALAGLATDSKADADAAGKGAAGEEAGGQEEGDEEEEEFPEDAFHKQDVLSMHYLAEKKKQQARMKEKQAEAERERQAKIARAKAGDKSISLEGSDGGIITEIIGGDDDDDDDDDNDMPSLPAGFPGTEGAGSDDDDDDDDDDGGDDFLKAATQFELLD